MEQLFKQISPEELCNNFNIFNLVGKDFFAVTAGNHEHYNSMVGSGGGFGLLFRKPNVWCTIRSDRYTLELIEKEQKFTLSYFFDEYKQKMLFLGNKSGRDSKKMEEVELTTIKTSSGNISFEEANLIIECKLIQITTPGLDDFYSKEAKEWLNDTYKSTSDYRKYVFGEITHVWVKK